MGVSSEGNLKTGQIAERMKMWSIARVAHTSDEIGRDD
jgi:hypothetical protein